MEKCSSNKGLHKLGRKGVLQKAKPQKGKKEGVGKKRTGANTFWARRWAETIRRRGPGLVKSLAEVPDRKSMFLSEKSKIGKRALPRTSRPRKQDSTVSWKVQNGTERGPPLLKNKWAGKKTTFFSKEETKTPSWAGPQAKKKNDHYLW